MTASIPIQLKESRWRRENLGGIQNYYQPDHFDHRYTKNNFDQRLTVTLLFPEAFIQAYFGTSTPLPLGPDQAYLDSPARKAIATRVFAQVQDQFDNWTMDDQSTMDEVASGLDGGNLFIYRRDYELAPQRDINFITFACILRPNTLDTFLEDYIQQRRNLRRGRPVYP